MRSLAILMTLALTSFAARGEAQTVEPRVEVTDILVDGRPLPAALASAVEEPLDRTLEPIRACYAQRLAARPELAGELRLRLWVSNRQVIRLNRESSTLNDATLERCVEAEIRRYRLPPEAPTGGAEIRCTLRFTRAPAEPSPPATSPPPTSPPTPSPAARAPGAPADLGALLSQLPPDVMEVPAGLLGRLPGIGGLFGDRVPDAPAEAAPARAGVGVRSVRGPLEPPVIAAGIEPASEPLWACYESGRARLPALEGDVDVDLRIAPDGSVRRASATAHTLRDRFTVRCVGRAAREARFPAASAATRATVRLRFAPEP